MYSSPNYYDEEPKDFYRDQRNKRKEEVGNKCEMTDAEENITTHHVVPRSLDGPDVKGNLQILEGNYHTGLHKQTNSEHTDLYFQRNFLQKKLAKDPWNEKVRAQMEAIDEVLIREYVEKLMAIKDDTRDKLIALTMESNMKTIRDLNLELKKMRSVLDGVRGKD